MRRSTSASSTTTAATATTSTPGRSRSPPVRSTALRWSTRTTAASATPATPATAAAMSSSTSSGGNDTAPAERSIIILSLPAHGTAEPDWDSVLFTADWDYLGPDLLIYAVC